MADIATIQNTAYTQTAGYLSQLQIFLNDLHALAGTEFDLQQIDPSLDISSVENALLALANDIQLNPPAPLPVGAMPLQIAPAPLPAEAEVNLPTLTTIPVPNIPVVTAPVVGQDVFTGTIPVLDALSAPEKPTLSLPTAPTFSNVVLPTITDIVLPTLTALSPADDLTAPSNLFSYSEPEYASALLDATKAKLLNDLQNGGYGIEPADEEALWARERDRELRNANAASMEATRQMAARGFSLPPGAMLAQLSSIQQSGLEKVSTASRDIAMKRADMYVENRRFTITESRELENLSINLHLSVMERALNSAKAVAEYGIALYNARVNKFNVLMEGFRAQVQAYSAQVQGALGQLEAQKIKLQVATTEVEVQRNQAQLYTTQVEGQRALIDMYRSDVAALEGLANVERLKIDLFRAEVESYSEKLRAGTLQLQGYEAQVKGNLTQAEIYRDQITAQLTQAEIAKAQAAVVEANARVKVENLRAAIAAAVGNADIYRSQTQGVAASNEAQARAFSARTEVFRALSTTYETLGRLDVSKFDATTRVSLENIRNSINLTKVALDIQLGAAKTGSETLSRTIEASLNQIVALQTASTTS
jgi:hypothetical protein